MMTTNEIIQNEISDAIMAALVKTIASQPTKYFPKGITYKISAASVQPAINKALIAAGLKPVTTKKVGAQLKIAAKGNKFSSKLQGESMYEAVKEYWIAIIGPQKDHGQSW